MFKGTVDIVLWQEPGNPPLAVQWPLGERHYVPPQPVQAKPLVDAVASRLTAKWVLFWDPTLGSPDPELIDALTEDRADVFHAGLKMGVAGIPEDIDFIQPTWYFNRDPSPDLQAISWRLSLRACLLRTDVIQALGYIDPVFETFDGAGLELGLRYIRQGAIIVHEPTLIKAQDVSSEISLSLRDRYALLIRHYSRKWVRYVFFRRGLGSGRVLRERKAYRDALSACASISRPVEAEAIYERRSTFDKKSYVRVSVIIPTLGRYDLLRDVLRHLSVQTIKPHQVICVDQNPPHERKADLYDEFKNLNLIVIFQEEQGQWLARNAAIERATGDCFLFFDDDSIIEPDFIEAHLEGVWKYHADISAGASISVVGAPVPHSYSYYRAADQFDSGNALVRREVIQKVGAFDRHYDKMRSGDADFGMRVYLTGGLLVHNPKAKRIHLKASFGGLRKFRSWDNFRHKGFFAPRPLPSVIYYALRHFSKRQAREDLLIGLAQSAIPYHLKRRASFGQWMKFVGLEILLSPLTLVRVARSIKTAKQMFNQGPRIPNLGLERCQNELAQEVR